MSLMTSTVLTAAPVHRMLMWNCTCCDGGQVEGMYNKLLDLSDRFRDEMGDITDNVSLATALETAWEDLPSKTGAPLHRSPGVHHSACQYQSVCCQGGACDRCPSLLRGGLQVTRRSGSCSTGTWQTWCDCLSLAHARIALDQ